MRFEAQPETLKDVGGEKTGPVVGLAGVASRWVSCPRVRYGVNQEGE
jgi:hypothetical protein